MRDDPLFGPFRVSDDSFRGVCGRAAQGREHGTSCSRRILGKIEIDDVVDLEHERRTADYRSIVVCMEDVAAVSTGHERKRDLDACGGGNSGNTTMNEVLLRKAAAHLIGVEAVENVLVRRRQLAEEIHPYRCGPLVGAREHVYVETDSHQ